MPSVRKEEIIYTAVMYLSKRQLQGRPTTMRQLCKRVGVGSFELLGLFEKYHVEYTLIAFGKPGSVSSTEIVFKSIPNDLADRAGVPADKVAEAYQKLLTEAEQAVSLTEKDPAITMEQLIDSVEEADPFVRHRITEEQYQILRPELIGYRELLRKAREQGFATSAIWRATGGDKMQYKLPGPLWRPFIYKGKRFFLREVLNYLEQSDMTYKNPLTAELKRRQRKEAEEPKYIEFEKPSLRRKKRKKKRYITQEFLTQEQ